MNKDKSNKEKEKKTAQNNADEENSIDNASLPKHMGLKFLVLQIAMISFGLFLYFILASYKSGKDEYLLTSQFDQSGQIVVSKTMPGDLPPQLDPSLVSQEEYIARREKALNRLQEEAQNNEWFAKGFNQVHDRSEGIKKIYGKNCDFFDFLDSELDIDALLATNRPFEVITPGDVDPKDTVAGRIIVYTDKDAIVKAVRCE
jgi:hypothetical protein